MKKNWLIVFLILILAIGAVAYYIFKPSKSIDPYAVIPLNSVVVMEVEDPASLKKEWKERRLSGILAAIPIGEKLFGRLSQLDSLAGNPSAPLPAVSVLTSLHRSGSEFDFIFYLPLQSSSKSWFENIEADLKRNNEIQWGQRETKGFTIHSVAFQKKKAGKLYYINHSGLFIASFSEVLLEDVIERLESQNQTLFWKKEQVKKEKDLGGKVTVYINYNQLPGLLSAFSDDPVYKKLSSFAEESVLDLKLSEGQIFLNGYSYTSGKNVYLDLFKGQLPQDFQVKNYLPLNTQTVFYLGFDKPEKLYSDLNNYLKIHDPEILSIRDSLSGKDSSKVFEIFRILRSELTVCSIKDSSEGKLIFMKSVDPEGLLKNISYFTGDSSLNVQGFIGKLPGKNIAQALFGRLFGGIEETYYLLLDEYLVFSGSPELLNQLTEAVNGENVWGKTLAFSSFLEENVSPVNVGYFINPSLVDSKVIKEDITDKIQMISLQFSNLGGPCLTNFIVNYDPFQEEQVAEVQEDHAVTFESSIVSALFPENGKGLFIQDSAYLHYLNSKGDTIWKYSLKQSEQIPSIYAADLDLDKSQDFLFAQGNGIYALDKNGKDLKNYPLKLNDSLRFEQFSVIDYNGDKEYRLVAADRNGHVYFFDKEGTNLEGWTPHAFGGPLLDKVRHMRLKGKDYILAIEKRGMVHLLNRRGEEFPGFPVNVHSELSQGVSVRKGAGDENTFLMLGDELGESFFINLDGKAVKKNERTFLLRDERSGSSMIIKRDDLSYEVLDMQGKPQYKVHSNQRFPSMSIYKTSANGEVLALWNQDYYMIAGKGGKILAEGQGKNIQDIKVFFHEKKNTLTVFRISSSRVDIKDFSY